MAVWSHVNATCSVSSGCGLADRSRGHDAWPSSSSRNSWSLLPGVRDGNSHFRLQIDVLRDAGAITSRGAWAGRVARTLLHLGRTHYLTPRLLKSRPTVAAERATVAKGRKQSVRWFRLEDLPEAWAEVEHALGRTIPFPWHARTPEGEDWRALYDATLQARVAELYRPDLEMFGYDAL